MVHEASKYWLDRYEDLCRLSESMTDPQAKKLMRNVAAGYKRLARHSAEQQTLADILPKDKPPPTRTEV